MTVLIHSSNKYLLCTCYIQGVLNALGKLQHKLNKLIHCPLRACILVKKLRINKYKISGNVDVIIKGRAG